MAFSRSTGKSTLTRWTPRPGRVAFSNSRWALKSSPESCILSRRAGLSALVCEVSRFFLCVRAAGRDDADFFIAVSDESGPRCLANSSDHLMAHFVEASSRYLESVGISPNPLSLDEVDSMFFLVRCRLRRIEFGQRAMRYRNYTITMLRLEWLFAEVRGPPADGSARLA